MAVLLDTDVSIELLRRNAHALDCLANCADEIFATPLPRFG